MLAKIHASIQNIHGMIGEKEAGEWEAGKKERETDKADKPKTPPVRPKRVKRAIFSQKYAKNWTKIHDNMFLQQQKKAGEVEVEVAGTSAQAAAAAAAEENAQLLAEKESLKEMLKEQYQQLLEMDEMMREKLFILQVKS